MIDLTHLSDTDAGAEIARIAAGEPTTTSPIAGLQFHSYARDDGMDGVVMPAAGDRLRLVRAPDNEYDPCAIEVWWRNDHRLGHLPRVLDGDLAPVLDAGEPVRAYVLDAGTGRAWSAQVLLVGKGVQKTLDEDDAWEEERWQRLRDSWDGEEPF